MKKNQLDEKLLEEIQEGKDGYEGDEDLNELEDLLDESKRTIREHLNKLSDTTLQDIHDAYECAKLYLYLVRCKDCNRLKNKGYVCPHCGDTKGSDDDD